MRVKIPPISAISSILLGGVIALVSTGSFVIDIVNTRNPIAIGIDLFVMSISYLTVWQGINYTILDKIAKRNMDDAFDNRVKPLISLLTETAGKVNVLEKDVLTTNLKISTTLDYVIKSQDMDASKMMIYPGASFKFIAKILVLIMFTFSSLVYVSSYPLGIVHYFILSIFVAWWAVITSEYKLFGNTTAWVWVIVPVMIIPTAGIIMSAVYGLNIMIGLLFLFLFIYVYGYYSWASCLATGFKLIDLRPIAYMVKDRLKKDKNKENVLAEFRGL